MKRKEYQVSMNGEVFIIKFSWNSARKAVVEKAKQLANLHDCTFRMVDESYTRSTDWRKEFIYGKFLWEGGGITATFEIKLLT